MDVLEALSMHLMIKEQLEKQFNTKLQDVDKNDDSSKKIIAEIKSKIQKEMKDLKNNDENID